MKIQKSLAILCLIAVSAAFSSCGKNDPEGNEPIETVTEEIIETTITTSAPKESSETSLASKAVLASDSTDELEVIIEQDITDTIDNLTFEYEELIAGIDTYRDYINNADSITAFYSKIETEHRALCFRMCEYSLSYAELVINSDSSFDEKYDELEKMYDTVYDLYGEDIYDGIYDGLMKDIYDDIYDGVLRDAFRDRDTTENIYDIRSDEYSNWSDTRSDIYSDWSDFRSDVYDFCSDMRSAMYDDNTEKAEKKLERFRKKLDKQSEKLNDTENDVQSIVQTAIVSEAIMETVTEESSEKGIRPEIKKIIDEFEECVNEYCSLMERYEEDPEDLGLLSDMLDFLEKYEEKTKEFEELDTSDLSEEELKYLTEVQLRLSGKMISLS